MITELVLSRWKSFESARLNIDPLTILIGLNASGKSNLLDAFVFLSRIANGMPFLSALQGDTNNPPIRGGIEWAARKGSDTFTVGVIVSSDILTDFEYSVTCRIDKNYCDLISESLLRVKYRPIQKDGRRGSRAGQIKIYSTDVCSPDSPNIVGRLYNEKGGSPRAFNRNTSILFQIFAQKNRQEISEGVHCVMESLRNIFILDPIPSHMRSFTGLSERLSPDAANIAGVIATLADDQKVEFEAAIQNYATRLPEKEIGKVFAETVGKFRTDAMLYCEERFGEKDPYSTVDARGMSDGTLRFIAILISVLTRPRGSLLIIEEIDNGLHPSRANVLIQMLQELGNKKNIDILFTTHNTAMLDLLGSKMLIPFITIVHRNQDSGASELILLEEIRLLGKMLAYGPLGKLSSSGMIEKNQDQASFIFS
jgi:energy-coupling factor transporter ATP-binding protein EcfA2